MHSLTRAQTAASWACQTTVAVILLQTLFFKFTAAEESVYIFSLLHAEPWGRVGSGIVELAAAAMLLYPPAVPFGAALTIATMTGAILSHLFVLGIDVKGDGGLLFALALTAFLGSVVVLILRRGTIPVIGRYFEVAS